ncbi:hypothetical protein [Fulvivirga sp.]|uniref:hypothetical protein n=1 Tax=Fulvivirga sp. TaxID=1931237 RepID=UPI0032EAD1DB
MKSVYKILILITLVISCQAQTNKKAESVGDRFSISEMQKASTASKVISFAL